LCRDIRREEEEDRIKESLAERLTNAAHVIARRRVVLAERDEDLSVGGRNEGPFAQGQVEPAIRRADDVKHRLDLAMRYDLADDAFDVGETPFVFLDAHPGRTSHVKLHETGVDVRKEVAPDEREDRERNQDERGKSNNHEPAPRKRKREKT